MTFTNVDIDVETLPRSADVHFQDLHPRYARVVLGLSLVFPVLIFLVATAFFFIGALVPGGDVPPPAALLFIAFGASMLGFLPWFAWKSARLIRYALREDDVIVQSGVFWKKETVQPIRRIQHVEQHQGPLDRKFGLYELKLFSAGTAYLRFSIPGLDADTASRIRQFILNVQGDGWGADEATEPSEAAAHAHEPTGLVTAAARSDSDG